MMASRVTRRSFALGILAAAALLGGCAGMGVSKPAKERVVLQVSDGDPKTWNQALNVVANMKANYAKRGVESEIQIVAFGMGIQMLKDDATVANRVRETMKGGAQMVACENSMGRFKLTKDMMVDDITYSETGVIYIIEKQREGWSVVRP
jgi:intracellular sulfur oxidation DsrE/DsrF family protein